jgi:UDP-glucose 4-epimerase
MQIYANKKILITGGLGFIGSNLAKKLVELGSKVTIVDSLIPAYGGNTFNVREIEGKVDCNICDVRDPYAMRHLIKNQDLLFNLAGQTSHLDSMTDPFTDLDINTKSQLSILEACKEVNRNIRIVFASTRQIYGKPDTLPVSEQHPIRPVDVNGINKFAGEAYHNLYGQVYGIETTVLRLTNTYGPGMRIKDARQTFLGIWINNIIKGKPIEIYGSGDQLRDFNFVDDCVDALLLAGMHKEAVGKTYNLGANKKYTLNSVAQILVNLSKGGSSRLIPFPENRKQIDIGDYYSDYSLIKSEIGWDPKIDIENGLMQTLRFYEQHYSHYLD